MAQFFRNLGYLWLFGTAVPKRFELLTPNLACKFSTSMRNSMPNFSHLGWILVCFLAKKWKNWAKKWKKLGFLAISAIWVVWASKFFAWMILGLGCTIMQNGKLLWLQVLKKINFEFFQNFEISHFGYKMGFFSLDVWKKIWNLTHMTHNTHNCLSQNFVLVVQT